MPQREHLLVRTCRFCGKEFWAANPTALYDTARCRMKHFRWRKHLPSCADQAQHYIQMIEDYLKYPDAVPLATRKLLALRQLIQEILDDNRIRSVK